MSDAVRQAALLEIRRYVESSIERIDKDPRFHYPPVNTGINAPLALIQTAMEAKMEVLETLRALIPEPDDE